MPNAGVFSEGQTRVVARSLIAKLRGQAEPEGYDGRGSCYTEFGHGRIGRIDVDFLSGPKPTGKFQQPSAPLVAEKTQFGTSRKARWFSG